MRTEHGKVGKKNIQMPSYSQRNLVYIYIHRIPAYAYTQMHIHVGCLWSMAFQIHGVHWRKWKTFCFTLAQTDAKPCSQSKSGAMVFVSQKHGNPFYAWNNHKIIRLMFFIVFFNYLIPFVYIYKNYIYTILINIIQSYFQFNMLNI